KKISHRNVCSSVLSFRRFQSHIAHNHETLRVRIRRHHFRTINPLLERPALFEISQLPLPNLAHQKHAAVTAAEVFVAARGDRALPGLRDFVFEHDDVDGIRIDIAEPTFSGKDGSDYPRPIQFRLCPHLPPFLDPYPSALSGERDGTHLEVN